MLDAEIFNNETALSEYRSDVWRVVESQEHVATSNVVDDLDEQAVLESLLDEVKPRYRIGTENMHYLLKTAFRYPPLKWGSRFGTQLMPSYFYASETQVTALHECAYYRFLFLDDMEEPFLAPIRSEFCLFNVFLTSDKCLDLLSDDFLAVQKKITDPASYAYSHAIGEWAYAKKNVAMIRFQSARCFEGVNVAVAEPKIIRSKRPKRQVFWLCLMNEGVVSFSSRESKQNFTFGRDDFFYGDTFFRVSD